MPSSMQLTGQSPNDPLWVGAKSTITNSDPGTPIDAEKLYKEKHYLLWELNDILPMINKTFDEEFSISYNLLS